MKTLILDGSHLNDDTSERVLASLQANLEIRGWETQSVTLREKRSAYARVISIAGCAAPASVTLMTITASSPNSLFKTTLSSCSRPLPLAVFLRSSNASWITSFKTSRRSSPQSTAKSTTKKDTNATQISSSSAGWMSQIQKPNPSFAISSTACPST